jgi:hypothetical protein
MATMAEPIRPEVPNFISSFSEKKSYFYFNHIIDADTATLTVEAIGPNLAMTFHHSRALTVLGPCKIKEALERKTAGFLSHIRNGERHVIAWAESGHGCGRRIGDLLDAPPRSGILPNRIWSLRGAAMGKLLGVKMISPFDKQIPGHFQEERRGIFSGSHVEIKLAVHGICTLLELFGITRDFDNIRRSHLKRLRKAQWDDGSRPAFEIYFSRKHCHKCGKFVRELQDLTRVSIALRWHQRVTMMEYEPPRARRAAKKVSQTLSTREAIVIEDEDTVDESDVGFDDEVAWVSTHLRREVVEIADEIMEVAESDDQTISLLSPSPSPSVVPESTLDTLTNSVEQYLSDLLYVIGQVGISPAHARGAVLSLARRIRANRQHLNIEKPLPATPVMEPPWDAWGTSDDERWGRGDEVNMMLTPSTGRTRRWARSSSPWDRNEDERPDMGDESFVTDSTSHSNTGYGRALRLSAHFRNLEGPSEPLDDLQLTQQGITQRAEHMSTPESPQAGSSTDDDLEYARQRRTPRSRRIFSPEGSPF